MSKCDQLRKALVSWGKDKYLSLLKKNEELTKENQRLRLQNQRLYQKNKSISKRLHSLDGKAAIQEENQKQYVVYDNKTDEILIIGNAQQCADYLGISIQNFRWRMYPTGQKRATKTKIVDIDKYDRQEEQK